MQVGFGPGKFIAMIIVAPEYAPTSSTIMRVSAHPSSS